MIARILFALLIFIVVTVIMTGSYLWALLGTIFWNPLAFGDAYNNMGFFVQYEPVLVCLRHGVKASLR